jgi:hypothetical protein
VNDSTLSLLLPLARLPRPEVCKTRAKNARVENMDSKSAALTSGGMSVGAKNATLMSVALRSGGVKTVATGPLVEGAESGVEGSGRRVEVPSTPSGEPHREPTPEPAVEEPEVEPSSIEDRPSEVSAAAPDRSGIGEEVEREVSMPSGENRAADEFFEEGRSQQPTEETEERRIFRASRFLRRRG